MLEIAAGKLVAGALLAGGVTVTGVAATSDCPAGQEKTVFGCAEVQHYEGETVQRGTGKISAVTPSQGVTLRDKNGNRTGSGLSNQDQFEWLGGKKPGKNGDGVLIEVKQITQGKGGWGSDYIGWIPVKYTQAPQMFN